jgi:PhzF family phenazine biosynthesis protein
MEREFVEVDVFTDVPYRGNPLAVVLDGDGLTTDTMQRFANWTNFSETAFLFTPTDPVADYLVRIFTTSTELEFAGHPTLGSCHAWLEHGGVPKDRGCVVQQCGVGLIDIRRNDTGRLAFAAPPTVRSGPLDDATTRRVAAALDVSLDAIVDAAWVDNGPGWMGVLLGSAEEVLALGVPDTDLKIGVIGALPPGSDHAYEVRAFFPSGGRTLEDPVTGSLNASVAQWLISTGRRGIIHIAVDDDGQVWVGGDVVTCVRGTVGI